jgi:hypothetical protein
VETGREARNRLADAPFEEDDEHAVARADGEQVQQHRLEGQHQRTEGAHQDDVGQNEHRQDEPREHAVGTIEEVHALWRTPAREHAYALGEPRTRDDVAAQAIDEALRRFVAVLVLPRDNELLVAPARIYVTSPEPVLNERDFWIGLDTRAQTLDGGLDLGVAHRASVAGVDHRGRRRERTGADGGSEDVQSADRLRRLRNSLCRTRCELQGEHGNRGGQKDGDTCGEEAERALHDRARKPRPEAVLHVGPREVRKR